jgi:hypothetical protein
MWRQIAAVAVVVLAGGSMLPAQMSAEEALRRMQEKEGKTAARAATQPASPPAGPGALTPSGPKPADAAPAGQPGTGFRWPNADADSDNDGPGPARFAAGVTAILQKLRAALPADASLAVRAMHQAEFSALRDLRHVLRETDQALTALETAGRADPGTFKTPADFGPRFRLFKAARQALFQAREACRGFPEHLADRLRHSNTPPDVAEVRIKMHAAVGNPADQIDLLLFRQQRMVEIEEQLLVILRAQWGNWQADPGGKTAKMGNAGSVSGYNGLVDQHNKLIDATPEEIAALRSREAPRPGATQPAAP